MLLLPFSHGGKGEKPVDLVLSCVDNFEARMAINTVRALFHFDVLNFLFLFYFNSICNRTWIMGKIGLCVNLKGTSLLHQIGPKLLEIVTTFQNLLYNMKVHLSFRCTKNWLSLAPI